MMQLRNTILVGLILMSISAFAEEWEVPAEKAGKVSTYQFSEEFKNKGKDVYMKNCQSCHGDPTKKNYMALVPPPGDPAEEDFQNQTDGALFYKITNGRGAMPQFKTVLKEEERWQVISFIRSFNPEYIQPEVLATEAFSGQGAKLMLELLDGVNQIKASVIGYEKNDSFPVKGAEVLLYIDRYFGQLQLGESVITNEQGIAVFELNNNIKADTAGLVAFTARLADEDQFGTVESKATFAVGEPNTKPSLRAQRSMWNTRNKAPLWVVTSYTLVLIGVWGVIASILLLLKRIKEAGDKLEE